MILMQIYSRNAPVTYAAESVMQLQMPPEKTKVMALSDMDLMGRTGRTSRLRDIAELKMQIINYAKTREVYAEYRKTGYSKRFLESHRDEILLHQAAKKAFDLHQAAKKAFNKRGIKKLPHVKDLSSEYGSILAEKRKFYEEYRAVKKEMMNYQIAKQDIDRFLKIDEEQGRQQEKTINGQVAVMRLLSALFLFAAKRRP